MKPLKLKKCVCPNNKKVIREHLTTCPIGCLKCEKPMPERDAK
jgi:hypothetical protein